LLELVLTLFRLILIAVFARKLIASIKQRIMIKKVLGVGLRSTTLGLLGLDEE